METKAVTKFVRETFKLAFALTISLVVVAVLAGLAVVAYRKTAEDRRAKEVRAANAEAQRIQDEQHAEHERMIAPLRSLIAWDEKSLPIGRATLATKWSNGYVFIRFALSDLPKGGLTFSDRANFTIQFEDADGFTIGQAVAERHAITSMLDSDGKVGAYGWEGSVALAPEYYGGVKAWDLVWRGVDVARPSRSSTSAVRPAPAWRSKDNWRRLRQGMSEADVRTILGEPTRVDSGGLTYWTYGAKNWYGNPHVIFSNGRVYGWQEP